MLTLDGCRTRQQRFLRALDEAGLSGALISHPRDIYYLTGLLPENPTAPIPSLLFLGPGLRSWLITGMDDGEAVVDERLSYPRHELFTLNPDNVRRLCACLPDLARRTQNLARIGFQRESLLHAVAAAFTAAASPRGWREIDSLLETLQLRKDPDELVCLQRAMDATLAGYRRAEELLRPGAPALTELEVLTECQAAAQRHTGSGHFYSGDFRSGEMGGPARNRRLERGELYIIDAWSDVDGYWSDLARTWVVGGQPTDLQHSVFEHLAGILKAVPELARAGRDTRDFWREIDARLREHPHLADAGLVHHAGHGVGLRVHEGPDLNRDRGGVFEPGNVFTCEPGAYTEELRGGVRVENLFLVTEAGTALLSDFPLRLAAP